MLNNGDQAYWVVKKDYGLLKDQTYKPTIQYNVGLEGLTMVTGTPNHIFMTV